MLHRRRLEQKEQGHISTIFCQKVWHMDEFLALKCYPLFTLFGFKDQEGDCFRRF